MAKKTVISQLASVGEGALGKIAQNPATRTALQGAMQLKDKGERFVHGLESVEERLVAIERRLDAVEKANKPKRATTTARSAASKPRATAGKVKPTT
jgi:hypothetical protein